MKKDLITKTLNKMYPDAKAELDYTNNFELLIAVVLSAQTTDIGVNRVTPELFNKFPTPELLMNANQEEVEDLIKTIGLYRSKAKNIIGLSKILVEKHNSVVPSKRSHLEALPGVGRKTANVVLSNAFGKNYIAVDTHVSRVSKRLGIALESDNVLTVEKKIESFFDKGDLHKLHHQLIFFGRYHCTARKPKCDVCELKEVCNFYKKMKK
ncbi:MAG: endonuclease III [Acholeplasmataceae bacterium]|nr:endonuclease III [Acholeplasmataceae bacterium]